MDIEKYIGVKYGRLVIGEHADGKSSRMFVFKCDCGGSKIASVYDVARGFTTSCGCLKRENAAAMGSAMRGKNVRDLVGRRFGMLTVTSQAPPNKHQCSTWLCKCDCGTEKVVSANHLVTGNTASCGCARRDGLVVRPENKRAASNAYVKNRYRTDVRYSVNRRAFQLIHATLKARNSTKSDTWESLVGYSLDDLMARLMETMPAGYTWDDFLSGALEIEHIVPLAVFNFTEDTDLDFRRAWALGNLRLLPSAENQAKADKLDGQFQPSLSF